MAEDHDDVIVAIKNDGHIQWYKADREIWILDRKKWWKDFIDNGIECPKDDAQDRFGIFVVDNQNKNQFIKEIEPFKISNDQLSEFREKIKQSTDIWDSFDLFPIAFIDFDEKKFSACYAHPGNVPIERYIPDGWSGKFIDFMRNFNNEIMPINIRYWVIDGIDYLEKLSS
ncbi:hypothetical protein M2263_002808 [Providencia alcalifaciens]|nr:hypothetical protein [Providencia alcalifaciens]